MLELIATVGAALVVTTYWASIKWNNPGWFDAANVLGAVLMAPINISFGLWFAVVLNIMFGGVGAYGLIKRHAPNASTSMRKDIDVIVKR